MGKKWIIFGTIILVIGGGYYYYTAKNTTQTRPSMGSTFATVQTGSIRTVVKATGKVYPVQESSLSFTKQGTITKIYKKVGDTVTKDEVLAEIDATSAYMDIKSANINLSNARNTYNNLINGGIEKEKIQSANSLSDAQNQLTLLQKQYNNLLTERDNAIKNAETNVKLAEANLEIAKGEFEYAEKNISTDTTSNNLERDISSAYTTLEQIYQYIPDYIKDIKDLSLIDDKTNPKYGDLGAKDSGIKASVESYYTTAISEQASFESSFTSLKSNPTSVTLLLSTLSKTKTILSTLNNLSTLIVAEYRASNESVYIPNTLISSTVAEMQTLSSTITSKLNSVTSTIATLKGYGDDEIQKLSDKNTLKSKETNVSTAENNLTKAKQDLTTTKTSYEAKILSAEQGLTAAQNSLKYNEISHSTTINSGVKSELAAANNSVQSAELNLEKAKLALKDYQIIANFDGVITDIPWHVGDTSTSSESISVQNKDAYEIQVSLDQADVVKVKAGMPVNITLDAYADATWTGTVSSVSSTPSESSSVVSYTAKILLNTVDKEIYSQMSATIEIITASKNDVLVIPSSTVKSEKGVSYVEIVKDSRSGETTKTEVSLGVTDDSSIEVLSGVTLGEKLKLQTITKTSSGTGSSSSTRSSSNNAGMGMGGPPGGF